MSVGEKMKTILVDGLKSGTDTPYPIKVDATGAVSVNVESSFQTGIFISDTMKTLSGSAQSVTIPSNTKYAIAEAKGGDINVRINNTASATTGHYIPAGSARIIHLVSASSLSVYGPTGASAFFNFYR